MIIKSSAGTEHVRAEYSITRDINGIPTLETEYFQPIHHHVDPIKVHIKDSDDVYIVVINESDTVVDSSRVKLTAVHSLIYDFTGSRIYEEITQHFSIEGILSIVFDDTDYDFEVAGDRSYYAMQFQNFGGARTRLELLNQICDRWECEYDVVGNMVYIKDKVGAKDTENKKFRYLMNINDSKVEFDITEGATYIKGYFGKKPDEDDEETENTYFELDYTHQLANQYGIRHAEPYSNENITTTETAEQYLKNRLENTWRLSIDIDVVELESSTNSEYFLGDVVWAIDERIDIDMQTRIIKIVKTYDIDDRLISTNVILGNKSFVDYVLGSTSGVSDYVTLEDLERESLSIEEEIVRKMAEFDNAFNLARDQMRAEFNQGLADAQAEIEALDEKMATEIATEISSFEDAFNSEVQAAKDLAEQKAIEHADIVRGELNTFAGVHSQIVQDLEDNVMDIDNFLGNARDIPLDQRLLDMTQVFDERINNIREGNYNMIRGSSLDESTIIFLNGMDLVTDERINYVSAWSNAGFPYLRFLENITLEAGKQYTLSFDYRTDVVPEMDVVRIRGNDGTWYHIRDVENHDESNIYELVMDNMWHRAYVRFTLTEDITGRLDIGTDYVAGDTTRGILHIRLPYLTTTGRTQWLFHPLDTTQNVEEVSQRLTLLEDGYKQMIVRSEWDAEMNSLNQTIRDYQTTVDGVEDTIVQLQDNDVIVRGREVIDTVEGFSRKVWLGDIDRPNILPYTNFESADNRDKWRAWNANVTGAFRDYMIIQSLDNLDSIGARTPPIGEYVEPGETYTLSWEASYHYPQDMRTDFTYMFVMNLADGTYSSVIPTPTSEIISTGHNVIYRKYTTTFVMPDVSDESTIIIGTRVNSVGNTVHFRIRNTKLERGNVASPFKTSFSMLEQRADEISLLVQDIDGSGLIRQSDITVSSSSVRIGSTQILNDDVLASVLNVSPSAIDMITQKMRLSGDLYVDGDITSLAISAVEGNFASLIVANLETNKLRARHINANAIGADHLWVDSALINKLIANSILTSEMRAQSITAVRADIGDLRTRILTSNVVVSDHISSSNAMIDKLFASNALISRLTSKSAFIGQIQTIDLAADQVRVGFNGISRNVTITSDGVDISGGALTIRRPDGAVWVQNGVPRYQLTAQVNQFILADSDAVWNGANYVTTARELQTVSTIYTVHDGRYLDVHVITGLTNASSSASVVIEVQVSGFGYTGSTNDAETASVFTSRGSTSTRIITIDMGVPTYNARQFYVSFGLASNTLSDNIATMRINRAVVRG